MPTMQVEVTPPAPDGALDPVLVALDEALEPFAALVVDELVPLP